MLFQDYLLALQNKFCGLLIEVPDGDELQVLIISDSVIFLKFCDQTVDIGVVIDTKRQGKGRILDDVHMDRKTGKQREYIIENFLVNEGKIPGGNRHEHLVEFKDEAGDLGFLSRTGMDQRAG